MVEQQLEVKEFLITFPDVFTDVPGKTNLITHDIQLKEERPIFKKNILTSIRFTITGEKGSK